MKHWADYERRNQAHAGGGDNGGAGKWEREGSGTYDGERVSKYAATYTEHRWSRRAKVEIVNETYRESEIVEDITPGGGYRRSGRSNTV